MKKIQFIIFLFALLICLRDGKGIVFPGDNILIYKTIQNGSQQIRIGVVYNMSGDEVTQIPADAILGVGAIDDSNLVPKKEL